MAKTLYDLMNWPEIETITYSEADDPHSILGPHKISKGLLVQAFYPGAVRMLLKLKENGMEYPMELVEEPGFFAVLLPKKTKPEYTFVVTDASGACTELEDPYRFEPVWELEDTQRFNCGIHYTVYEKMGAIPMTIDGVDGVLFSVWAPNAVRVSVIGSFNGWDGRIHQMRRLWDSGIFELFIPGVECGSEYKYELKLKGSQLSIKTDPYARCISAFPDANSVVVQLDAYEWKDAAWMKQRRENISLDAPVSVYQLQLNTFLPKTSDGSYPGYCELADAICAHVKKMGYTHVQLMPVMEYVDEAQNGYHTLGYYAPTGRFGEPDKLQYLIDALHQQQIGVLLEWAPIYFDLCDTGLRAFDGTFLYEHMDERQGYHKKEQAGIFNYARPEVGNFLIANVLHWLKLYHVDGMVVHKADSVLYLDYNKNAGEWIPNMYGGNENLDGIELFKHMNSIVKKQHADVLLLAEDHSGWRGLTDSVEEGGLGFDLKLNYGWTEEMLSYMQLDPLFRSGSYYDMLMDMVYAYTDKFILPLTQEYVYGSLGSIYEKMPGNEPTRFAAMKVLYGYMMTHPGKKLLFMGQDYGDKQSWDGQRALSGEAMRVSPHCELAQYVSHWNAYYREQPALYQKDFTEDGFEWINQISANENIIVFVRKGNTRQDTLLVVCNFVPVLWDNYKIGVPYAGKYKEVLNSDAQVFGGSGCINPRIKQSKEEECDARKHSIRIKIAPLSISVFRFQEADERNAESKASLKKQLQRKMQEAENIGDVEKQLRAAKAVEEIRRRKRR